jgi:hypothetical protein
LAARAGLVARAVLAPRTLPRRTAFFAVFAFFLVFVMDALRLPLIS